MTQASPSGFDPRPLFKMVGQGAAGLAKFARGLKAAGEGRDSLEVTTSVTYYAALLVAFATTWAGMWAIAKEFDPQAGFIEWLITLFVAALLFVGQNLMVKVIRSYAAMPVRGIALSFYGVLAAISIAFAFSFWWALLASRDYTRDMVETNVAQVQRIANASEASLTTLVRATSGLETYSATQATKEGDEGPSGGGTCGDGSSGRRGPRTRLRENDAAAFKQANTYISQMATPTAKAVADLRAQVDRINTPAFTKGGLQQRQATIDGINSQIETVGRQVRAAQTDTQLAQYTTQFRERLALEASTISMSGETFTCRDATLRNSLTASITAIDQLTKGESLQDQQIAFDEGGRAYYLAFQRLLSALIPTAAAPTAPRSEQAARQAVVQAGGAPSVSQPQTQTFGGKDWAYLFLAIFIDGLIAFAGLSKPRDALETIVSKSASSPKAGAIGDLLQRLRDGPDGFSTMIGPYHVSAHGAEYLLAPVNPGLEEVTAPYERAPYLVQNVALMLRQAGLAHETFPKGPMRHAILQRFDEMRMVSEKPSVSPPDPADVEPQDRWARLWGKLFKWTRHTVVDDFLDAPNDARAGRYRYFEVNRGVLIALALNELLRSSK